MQRLLFLTLVLVLPFFGRAAALEATPYDAMAVVHVDGLTDAQLSALAEHIGAERNITIEYACVWAGIVVLHFTDTNASERADVVTIVLRHLHEAGIEKGVEVQYVHVRATGPGKC